MFRIIREKPFLGTQANAELLIQYVDVIVPFAFRLFFLFLFFLLHVLLLRKNTMQNNHAFAYRSCKMKMKAERAHRMNGEKMICIGGGVHKTETLHHLWMDVGERAWYFFSGRPTTQ